MLLFYNKDHRTRSHDPGSIVKTCDQFTELLTGLYLVFVWSSNSRDF